MRRAVVPLVAGIAIAWVGSGALAGSVATPDQALRTCVDRWNQGNMVRWGPTLGSVSIRRLDTREEDELGLRDGLRRCTVSLATWAQRDRYTGCSGGAAMAGYPKSCVYRNRSWTCVINKAGGYECPIFHEPGPPLRNKNATTDERGFLTLDFPLTGTHAVPPLAWQGYPHIDGFIHPWTRAGELRQGLTFDQIGGARYHGNCLSGAPSEFTFDKSAIRCVSDVQFDPCFPPPGDWNRRGVVVACGAPGYTSFGRFVITKRF